MNATAFTQPVWMPPAVSVALHEPLAVGEHVDMAVVGGGIMGLSAALHAARLGLSVRVVEARNIGQGASGLNGGQVIPGLKYDPDWLIEHFGDERGEALIEFAASTADAVFDLIRDEKLSVPFVRNGWIQAAHTETALARSREARPPMARPRRRRPPARRGRNRGDDRRARLYRRLAGPPGRRHQSARLHARAGPHRQGGRRTHRERETVHRAAARGRRAGGFRRRSGAELRAESVVVATNAYSDGARSRARADHRARCIPSRSRRRRCRPIWPRRSCPDGQAVSDFRRILVYYRKSPDGRLVLGGRGRMALPKSAQDWAHLRARHAAPLSRHSPAWRSSGAGSAASR